MTFSVQWHVLYYRIEDKQVFICGFIMDARIGCKPTGLLDQRPIALTPRFLIEKSIA